MSDPRRTQSPGEIALRVTLGGVLGAVAAGVVAFCCVTLVAFTCFAATGGIKPRPSGYNAAATWAWRASLTVAPAVGFAVGAVWLVRNGRRW